MVMFWKTTAGPGLLPSFLCLALLPLSCLFIGFLLCLWFVDCQLSKLPMPLDGPYLLCRCLLYTQFSFLNCPCCASTGDVPGHCGNMELPGVLRADPVFKGGMRFFAQLIWAIGREI